jgi:hypothetical protein
MRRPFLQTLTGLRPMIKTCWEVLLRAEPPTSALGNPDTLVFMMDQTLNAYFTALRSPTPRRWLAHHPLLCGTLNETCPCGRNPLLHYFVSGEEAVVAIAAKALGDQSDPPTLKEDRLLSEVQLTFHYLAQHELQVFCDLCRGKCARARAGLVAGKRQGPPRGRRQRRLARSRWQSAAARAG